MTPVLQSRLDVAPWSDPVLGRLPGIRPAGPDDWVRIDDAYRGQMALRDALLRDRRDAVLALRPEARDAAAELYRLGLDRAGRAPGFRRDGGSMVRPDGGPVPLDPGDPLGTLGRLFQEDLCLIQDTGAGHVLTGAVLCFPASWTLSEKLGRPLGRIHRPVAAYDDDMARRIDRLFDGLRPGRPIWRANALFYDDAALFQPRREADPRPRSPGEPAYIRSERQVLQRLPETGAVLFSIHTTVIRRSDLTPDQAATLDAAGLGRG